MITAKSPVGGKDTIQASSNTFYQGLSLADLKGFQEKYPLNSRVVKGPDGKLTELVYRAGTSDGKIPPGLYATFLKRANDCFEKARAYADPAQAEAIDHLIRYYQTGDYAEWVAFGTAWVQNDATVDFRQWLHRSLSRRARRERKLAELCHYHRQARHHCHETAGGQCRLFRAEGSVGSRSTGATSFKLPVVKAVETLIETGDFSVNHNRRQSAERK